MTDISENPMGEWDPSAPADERGRVLFRQVVFLARQFDGDAISNTYTSTYEDAWDKIAHERRRIDFTDVEGYDQLEAELRRIRPPRS